MLLRRRSSAVGASDVAIVFATQYMSESIDSPTLSLPENQDALIHAVAAANSHTVVVLETGGPVSMPWIAEVSGVLASWYPGIGAVVKRLRISCLESSIPRASCRRPLRGRRLRRKMHGRGCRESMRFRSEVLR